VAERFSEKLTERMREMTYGRGVDEGTKVGPMIDQDQQSKVQELVEDAVGSGAKVLLGGEPVEGQGYFYPPTVLTDVPREARMWDEEIFGPVAPITPFDDEDEVIRWVNATEYGLVNYVFTEGLDRALRVAEAMESGMVGVNQGVVSNPAAPFGGVKESGLGREGGDVGIDEFLETKYVGISMG